MSNTYVKYMNAISSDELYEGLLAYGLFTEKLPPIFTTKPFFDYCQKMTSSFANTPRQYIYHESIRNTNTPRGYGIPTPMAYQRLCRCIADNWDNLKVHFSVHTAGQSHKVSRIHIRKFSVGSRLFKMNYNNWRTDGSPEPDLLIGNKYMVTADISNCFPSIYTHSLPWALAGKDIAKANRHKSKWYNKIDRYCQNCKHGETQGLLIGPHSSNLLAEIILTVVDKKLYDTGWRYIRNIDDYCCYVSTLEDGQRFLSELREALQFYNLALNHKKTEIKKLPVASEEQWIRQINSLHIIRSQKKRLDYKDVQAYLDSAIGLMKENGMNSAILNYTIKTLSGKKFTANAREYYIKTVLHLAIVYPYLISIVEDCILKHHDVEQALLKKFVEAIFNDGSQVVHYEAICYAIYFALKFDIELKNLEVQRVIDSQSCLYKVFAWIYFKERNDKKKLQALNTHAEVLSSCSEDFGANWLFVYEVLPESKLTNEWNAMKRAGISFIKSLDEIRASNTP